MCEEEQSHAALLILMDSVKEHQMKGGQRKRSTGFGGNPHSNDRQMDAPMGCRLLSLKVLRIVSGQRDTDADLTPKPNTRKKEGKLFF